LTQNGNDDAGHIANQEMEPVVSRDVRIKKFIVVSFFANMLSTVIIIDSERSY